jgi:phage I-like protein
MDGLKITTSSLLAAEIDDDGFQWIEVMPTATEARNGPWYFTITAEDLETYAEYIRGNPDTLPVDYDHSGISGGNSEAAGWFTGEADVRDVDGEPRLYAQVRWTTKAKEALADRRYRFISPEWEMKLRDAKTGLMTQAKKLLGATLTNRPYFNELAPVASDQPDDPAADAAEEEDNMDALRAALGLPEDATEEQILEAVNTAKTKAEEADKPRTPVRRKGETVNASVAQALGLPADADEATIIAAAQDVAEKADRVDEVQNEFGALSAQAARASELEKRIKVLEARNNNSQVDALLADATRKGKIAPAEKATLKKRFGTRPEDLEELLDARAENTFRMVPVGYGGDHEDGEDFQSVADEFESKEADGVDPESARLHVAAMKHLKAQGIAGNYSAQQYAEALDHASKALA